MSAESNLSIFMIKYLGKIETQFENTLPSGGQMGLNNEKNRGRKSRDTLPLRVFEFGFDFVEIFDLKVVSAVLSW